MVRPRSAIPPPECAVNLILNLKSARCFCLLSQAHIRRTFMHVPVSHFRYELHVFFIFSASMYLYIYIKFYVVCLISRVNNALVY